MSLKVYNYLTREIEEFEPLHEGWVSMYVCGPTVYDHSHVGHAKTYVSMDVVLRYLRYLGYRVRYVQNITDVGHLLDTGEDRILRGAARERVEPMELVELYTRSYFEDMDALRVTRPDISPRASGHIPEQIELVKELLARGHAYEADGSVYFSVESFPDYGKLSHRRVEEQLEGARVDVDAGKRHPADFALWKRAEPEHIMRWPSPWGEGFPGWHAECTAMSTKYLGQPFDIHGGGVDNLFPHNECEIAQAEAATGQPFARYWLLAGTLTVDGVNMSKSLGNFVTIKEALKRWRPEAIRLFVLNGHYRSRVDFSEEALDAASGGVERLHGAVAILRDRLRAADNGGAVSSLWADKLADVRTRFAQAMDEDFNTAGALGVLFELTREVNGLLGSGEPVGQATLAAIDGVYRDLGEAVLGLIPDPLPQQAGAGLEDALVRLLIEFRQEAREKKDWARADGIRDRLAEIGIALEDGPEGTRWRLGR
ncbi:MAG: cysteine--tRNA ligase [Chloroflexi bacterium]|nr:cysteine--tRNA ligase [Chloroflexota bacterium]